MGAWEGTPTFGIYENVQFFAVHETTQRAAIMAALGTKYGIAVT
jgi:hypothetical protein